MRITKRSLGAAVLVAASVMVGPAAGASPALSSSIASSTGQGTVAATRLAATAPGAGCAKTGANPSRARIAAVIEAVALQKKVPHQLLKVIAWQESSWRQFDSRGHTLVSGDGGIGMMQLTGATARQFSMCRLFTDVRYNIESGADVLLQKLAKAAAGVPTPPNRAVIENWYLPTRFYNGGGAAADAYAQRVFAWLSSPPAAIAGHTSPLRVTTPRAVWSGYTEPTRISAGAGGDWTFYSSSLSGAVVHRGNHAVHAWRPVYNLRNVTSGQCVDIPGYGRGAPNGPVNQYPCNYTDRDNQRFWFTPMRTYQGSAGTYVVYQIRSTTDGLCLDVPGTGANAPGTAVSEFPCQGASDNQYWYRVPREGGDWFVNARSRLCLDVAGTRAGADARLTLFPCNDADDHRWTRTRS